MTAYCILWIHHGIITDASPRLVDTRKNDVPASNSWWRPSYVWLCLSQDLPWRILFLLRSSKTTSTASKCLYHFDHKYCYVSPKCCPYLDKKLTSQQMFSCTACVWHFYWWNVAQLHSPAMEIITQKPLPSLLAAIHHSGQLFCL